MYSLQLLSSRASLDLVTWIAKCTMCKFAAIFGQLVGNEISLLALLSEFKISLAELSTSLWTTVPRNYPRKQLLGISPKKAVSRNYPREPIQILGIVENRAMYFEFLF